MSKYEVHVVSIHIFHGSPDAWALIALVTFLSSILVLGFSVVLCSVFVTYAVPRAEIYIFYVCFLPDHNNIRPYDALNQCTSSMPKPSINPYFSKANEH